MNQDRVEHLTAHTATVESQLKSKYAGFETEYDNGNSGDAKTIDWRNGQKQLLTVTGAPAVLTFVAPPALIGNFLLRLVQGSGGSKTVTWPAEVKWPSGTAPTLSTAAGAVDIVSFYWNGTNYYGECSKAFA